MATKKKTADKYTFGDADGIHEMYVYDDYDTVLESAKEYAKDGFGADNGCIVYKLVPVAKAERAESPVKITKL